MNIQALMQQAKKMQNSIQKKLNEFEEKEFSYSYQNDAILIKIKGNFEIVSINISDVLIDPEDKQTLNEMVQESINYAIKEIKKAKQEIMPANIPGMGSMF